jgi:hypothetical protein
LTKKAQAAFNNNDSRQGITSLLEKVSRGHLNPGNRNKRVGKLKHTIQLKDQAGGRVYLLKHNKKLYLVGLADKNNQNSVIRMLERKEKEFLKRAKDLKD